MTLTELQAAHARAKPNSRRRHELEIRLREERLKELRKEIEREIIRQDDERLM